MIHERLAPHPLGNILSMLAQVGGMRNTWVNDPSVEQDRSFTDELLPTYRDRINRIRTPKHIAISRIGILFVAKQACIACDPDADVPEHPLTD